MSAPVFDNGTVLSPDRELAQITAAVSGAPAAGIFGVSSVNSVYHELTHLNNKVTGGPVVTPWMVLDPQLRLNTLKACTSMAYSPAATPAVENPYSITAGRYKTA